MIFKEGQDWDVCQSSAPILIMFQSAPLYALTALTQFICLLEYLVLFGAIQMVELLWVERLSCNIN